MDLPALKTAQEKNTFVTERVFITPPEIEDGFGTLAKATKPPFAPIAEVFSRNILSAVRVAGLPFTMKWREATNLYFHAVVSAERIRQLKNKGSTNADGSLTEQSKNAAQAIAKERIDKDWNDSTTKRMADTVVNRLYALLHDKEFSDTAEELLRETLVMFWGAFEVFISSVVRELLNQQPKRATELLRNEKTRAHFPSKNVSIDVLADAGFDVSKSMGDLLFKDRHLDSLPVMRDILTTLFPHEPELQRALASENLWLFWQRRHLIVHRRGIVDQSYIQKTSDDLPIGRTLVIGSSYLELILSELKLIAELILPVLHASAAEPV